VIDNVYGDIGKHGKEIGFDVDGFFAGIATRVEKNLYPVTVDTAFSFVEGHLSFHNGIDTHILDEGDASQADLLLDAMIGYGLTGDPRPDVAAWIERVNAAAGRVLALDTPRA
jgi:NAD(P)H-hydrate repair Nnr-like enzyme with NAD(P)H-hydrate epimerase domain